MNNILFVFIHGAMHGKWCFDKKLIPLFNNDNYRVLNIDLPGCGEDNTNIDDINLDVYINTTVDKINNIIKNNDKIILIGHSMGGLTTSIIADIMHKKIESLIYIAAIIPENNKSLLEITNLDKSKNIFEITDDGKFMIISNDNIKNIFYNECSEDDIKFAKKKLRPQAIKPGCEIVKLSSNFDEIKKIYISTIKDNTIPLEQQKNMYYNVKNIKVIEIDSDHSPFFSKQEELYKIIINN